MTASGDANNTVVSVKRNEVIFRGADEGASAGFVDRLAQSKGGIIGAGIDRIDGPIKVRGEAPFAAEIDIQGMVFAALVYSSIPKGRIASLDTEDSETAPGVVLVMTHRNAPRMNAVPVLMTTEKANGGNSLPIMQDDLIHWNGQTIAVVLAETQEKADYAASLVRVSYDQKPSLIQFDVAKALGSEPTTYIDEPLHAVIGDAEAALCEAPYKVDVVYTTPYHSHNPIELHAVTVAWKDNCLRVHDAAQAVAFSAWTLGQVFGIDETDVHVSSPYVGGGFGSKLLWDHHVLAAAASKLAGKPVRMVLSREGVYRIVGGRAMTEQRVAIGADNDGHFKAIIHTGTVAMTNFNTLAEPFILSTRALYASDNMLLDVQAVRLDRVANTFMRGPGEAVGTFALESAIDELAYELHIDPIELRFRNEPKNHPVEGKPFSSRHLIDTFRDGADRFGWNQRGAPRSRCEGEWLVGLGCATAVYPYYRWTGGAARITLLANGTAVVSIGAHEMGMGTATVHTQVAAERLGITMDKVTFVYGDSTLPGTVLAGASQQTAVIGAAVIAAERALVDELLKLVTNHSALSGLKAEEVIGFNGGLAKVDEPDRFESYQSILNRAGRQDLSVEAEAQPPSEAENWAMYSFGAMFAEARVNTATGEVRIPRFLGSFDCGRILNSKTAASQLRGGIVMGIGLALMEETQFDGRTGRIMNPSLGDYHLPVHLDVPQIDVFWSDIPDPHAPMGARGIGEIGVTGVGAAIANAVFNATGKRIRDLPITLDKLM